MSIAQLVDFLNKTQRDPRLNEILYPYANPARAKDLIQEYEPNKFNAQKGLLSFDGFLRYLHNDVFLLLSFIIALALSSALANFRVIKTSQMTSKRE